MIGVGVVLAYALPLIQPPFITTPASDFGGVMASAASFALVALGLNIVIGYAGLLDLGYVGFYAVGAYTTGVLTSQHGHWPFFLVLPCAMIVTTVRGLLLGAPAIRVRGDYLAIVTLGFGEIISLVAKNTPWLGSAAGIKNIPPPPSIGPDPIGTDQDGLFQIPHLAWNGLVPSVDNLHKTPFLTFGVLDAIPYYWLILTFILVVLVADMMVNNSRVGRAWEATREDEDAAELMGVPTFRYKLLAFMLGAAIGGLAGVVARGRAGRLHQPGRLPPAPVDAVRGRRDHRWRRQPMGSDPGRCPGRLPAGEIQASERLPVAHLRTEPDGDRHVPAPGILPPRRTRRALAPRRRSRSSRGRSDRCLTPTPAGHCSRSTTSRSGSEACPHSTRSASTSGRARSSA